MIILPWKKTICFNLGRYALCHRPILASCGYEKLSCGRPGASIFPFWHPGTIFAPRATLEDHGKQQGHEGIRNQSFIDLGSYFDSLLGTEAWNFNSFRACFQITFSTDFRNEIRTPGAHETRFSHRMYCKKHFVTGLVFYDFGIDFPFFQKPWEQFSDFCCPGHKLER